MTSCSVRLTRARGRVLLALVLWSSVWRFLGLSSALPIASEGPTLERDGALDGGLDRLLATLARDDTRRDLEFRICGMAAKCHVFVQQVTQSQLSDDAEDGDDDASETQSGVPHDVDVYCRKVRYLRALADKLATFKQTSASSSSSDQQPVAEVATVAEELSLEAFFVAYAEPKTPVVLTQALDVGIADPDWDAFLTACFPDGAPKVALAYDDDACVTFLDAFRVPVVMVHDYIQRTNVSASPVFLPTVHRLSPAVGVSASEMVVCPYGLNMLLAPLAGSAQVALRNRAGLPLTTRTSSPNTHGATQEVTLSADASAAASSSDTLHLFGGYLERQPAAFQTTLSPRSLLFVPGSMVATVVAQDNDREEALSAVRGSPLALDIEASCLRLKWLEPVDDGGLKTQLYLVALREIAANDPLHAHAALTPHVDLAQDKVVVLDAATSVGKGGKPQPHEEDPWLSAKICNLFPDKTYQFRVAGVNGIGVGAWSATSDVVTMQEATSPLHGEIPVLRGIGDPEYTRTHDLSAILASLNSTGASSSSDSEGSASQSSAYAQQQRRRLVAADPTLVVTSLGPRAILSDVEQKLVVAQGASSQLTFPVWTSHHSPQKFRVSSGTVERSRNSSTVVVVVSKCVFCPQKSCAPSRSTRRRR